MFCRDNETQIFKRRRKYASIQFDAKARPFEVLGCFRHQEGEIVHDERRPDQHIAQLHRGVESF